MQPLHARGLGGGASEDVPDRAHCPGAAAAFSPSNLHRVWLSRSEFQVLSTLEAALAAHNAAHGTAATVLSGALVRWKASPIEPSEARHFLRFVDSMVPEDPPRLVLRPTALEIAVEDLSDEAPMATATAWRDGSAAEAENLHMLMEQKIQTVTLSSLASAAWRLQCGREWVKENNGDVDNGDLGPLLDRLPSFKDMARIARELEPSDRPQGAANGAPGAAAADEDAVSDDPDDFMALPSLPSFITDSEPDEDPERRPYSHLAGEEGGAAEEEGPETTSAGPEIPRPLPRPPLPRALKQLVQWPDPPQAAVATAAPALTLPLPRTRLPQAIAAAAAHAKPHPPVVQPMQWSYLAGAGAAAAAQAALTVKPRAAQAPPPVQQPPRGKELGGRTHKRERSRSLSPLLPHRRSLSPRQRDSRDWSSDRDRGRPRRPSDTSQEDLRYANRRRYRPPSDSRPRSPPPHRRSSSMSPAPSRGTGIGSSLDAASASIKADPNYPGRPNNHEPSAAVWQMSVPAAGVDIRSPEYLKYFFDPTWRAEAALVAALDGRGPGGITVADLHAEMGGLPQPYPRDLRPFFGFIAARRYLFDMPEEPKGFNPNALVYLRTRAFPMLQWKRWVLEALADLSQRGGGRRPRAYRAPLAEVLAAAPLPFDAPPSELETLRRDPDRFIKDRMWDSLVVTPHDWWQSVPHRARVTCLELRPFGSDEITFPEKCRDGHPKSCRLGPDCKFCHITDRDFHVAYSSRLR